MRAREFITERSKLPDSHISATPGMNRHPHLDNSSPYAPWRFAAHFLAGADGKNPYEHQPNVEGPSGQTLVTVAFSSEEDAMIRQAEKAFGIEAKRIQMSPPGSYEIDEIYKVSPVTAFNGYPR